MERVEYRFVQLILSHVTGDKITLGLLHWDRSTLRTAHSFQHLAVCPATAREVVMQTVLAQMRRARERVGVVAETTCVCGLAELIPLREGLGAALFWTPVQSAETRDAAGHFAQLTEVARLA